MKAVIWTEAFQMVIIILSLVVFTIKAALTIGSWDLMVESAKRTNRWNHNEQSLKIEERQPASSFNSLRCSVLQVAYRQTSAPYCLLATPVLKLWQDFTATLITTAFPDVLLYNSKAR
ncbi:hypothetical protein PoB_005079400 [Plakobranchus ocellatus]|uniref:Uncharacterized protein n=1 Tax=Plakobranchus ocellatus TaxID=259542 RepID=A0AAV4BVR7_9GAST|nr:hypothetical protein PoB_005079400 [Plakobranchus ocellatus]